MKKYLYLFLTVVCALALTACNDDDDPAAPVLEIVTSDIGFDAAGGTGTITLKSTDAFSAVSDKGWLTITGTTATAINYSVAESPEALQRSANITVKAGGVSRVVTILQEGAILKISQDPIAVSPSGEKPSYIAYDTSLETKPEVSVPAEVKWLKPTVEEGRIKLEADLNYTGARNTVLTVVQGWKPVEIPVTQEMVDLVDTKQIARDREAADIVVTPTQYLAIASATWDVQTDDGWITLTKEADKFTVSLTENTTGALRNGTVKVVSGEGAELASISVSQKIYSYEFFPGNWALVYGDSKVVPATISADPDGSKEFYIMTLNNFEVIVGYEDRGSAAVLTIVSQVMGRYNYDGGQADISLLPTTDKSTSFNTAEGIGYDCIYVLNQGNDMLIPEANAATKKLNLTINGLIFAGQDTKSGSWINFGNYHPFVGMMRIE